MRYAPVLGRLTKRIPGTHSFSDQFPNLEHSRLFYFGNNGKEEMYIGSADWMYRNLSRRVEVLVPIKDPRIRHFLKETILSGYLKDNVNARELRADGSYLRAKSIDGERRFDSQLEFEGRELNVVAKPGKREASGS